MARKTQELMVNAWRAGVVIPAFNIPHLPMMEPVVRALRDTGTFGLIQVARLEWEKFQAKSIRAIRDEYAICKDERFTRLHLDHVPVVDEDGSRVDFAAIIREALDLGYESVMVDGSRLPFAENAACSRQVAELAHAAGVPVEAELGAVLGHEAGPLPPYEELFASGQGFTDPDEARRFVESSGVDWLSVAIGNVHGAISGAAKSQKKVEARLNIEHLDAIRAAAAVPLVLHGGSGIRKEYLHRAFRHGIAKINVGTSLRQAYEKGVAHSVAAGQQAVYEAMVEIVRVELAVAGSAAVVNPPGC
ncbi:MAG: class II fructose-bisphosphate aldolase [Lentisphaeria bacterium]|nr:class II fructose-bisphosphate aldolase [Lentisphaeria bacterium]